MIYCNTPQGKVDIFSTVTNLEKSTKDISQSQKSQNNYIICFTERSGSTMLCSLLKQTGLMGIPEEYINPRGVMQNYLKQYPASDIFQYFDLLRCHQTSANGIFGMKVAFPDFEPLLLEGITAKLVTPIKFIFLTRHDIVLQAISSYIARNSGKWHNFKHQSNNQSDYKNVNYDKDKIVNLVNKLLREQLQWEKFFTLYSVIPYRITYEDVIANPSKVVQNLCNFLGETTDIEVTLSMSETQRVSDERNQIWADQFRAEHIL